MTSDEEKVEDVNCSFTLIDLFRKSQDDPVTGLLVLHALMKSGTEIPKDLRDWFAERLALTLDSNGEVSLDTAFGISGDGSLHNAFTVSNRYYKNLALVDEMHELVCVYNLSASLASRLIYERDTSNKESSPRFRRMSVETAESTRARYSKQKHLMGIIEPKYFSNFHVEYLEKFDVPRLSPSDRNELHSVINRVRKAIQAV